MLVPFWLAPTTPTASGREVNLRRGQVLVPVGTQQARKGTVVPLPLAMARRRQDSQKSRHMIRVTVEKSLRNGSVNQPAGFHKK